MRNRNHNKVWRRYEGKRLYHKNKNRYVVTFHESNLQWYYQVFDWYEKKYIARFGTDSHKAYAEAERLNRTQ